MSGCGGGELIYESHSDDEGGGSSELTLEGAKVRLRERRPGVDRRARGELTPDGLEALTSARAAVTRALADGVEPCLLADTLHLVYHLEDAEGAYWFSHCRSSEFSAPVAALVDVIGDIVAGLRGCEDNATVEVEGVCVSAF